MEQLLESVIKDSSKYPKVYAAAKSALEFMESYSRAPACDYRRKVLPVVSLTLESGNSKLSQQVVSVIHKLGKDDRFYSQELEEEQSSWMTQQVTDALSLLPSTGADIQTNFLQAILTLSYHHCWIVSGKLNLLQFLIHSFCILQVRSVCRCWHYVRILSIKQTAQPQKQLHKMWQQTQFHVLVSGSVRLTLREVWRM